MGRGGGRKESYRIYCSALKVRFPFHFDAGLPTWSLGGRLILIRFGANDIAFGVDTKCLQLLEPVEDVLQEVINRASDRGITPLHVAALKGDIETVRLLLDWELLLLMSLWKMEPQEIL
ncbi:hypothetical protein Bca4012_007419 [Brassica carinata]|uniref:Uncharacterized protein n=1 Tax=Brassica carinata TaxID=52824 RepID=A0A8X7RRB3_BRACI|nr:hypothetical protein Bca52824_038129 [Brassica carinata]